MTPELAALLDGPVAERFGRAGDGPRGPWFLHLHDPCGAWVFRADSDEIVTTGSTASALWLSHLLDVCGKCGAKVAMFSTGPGWIVSVDPGQGVRGAEAYCTTILESLCRAMLAVPA